MVTTVMRLIRITPPPSALPGGLRNPVREQRRVDTGAFQHLDGPALLVRRQRGEQIKTPGPRVTAQFRPPARTFHRRDGRRRPAVHPRLRNHGQRTGVLHGALPAEPVTDGALHEVAEHLGELRPTVEGRTDLRVRLDEECSRWAVSISRSPSRSARLRAPVTTEASSAARMASSSARFDAGC